MGLRFEKAPEVTDPEDGGLVNFRPPPETASLGLPTGFFAVFGFATFDFLIFDRGPGFCFLGWTAVLLFTSFDLAFVLGLGFALALTLAAVFALVLFFFFFLGFTTITHILNSN